MMRNPKLVVAVGLLAMSGAAATIAAGRGPPATLPADHPPLAGVVPLPPRLTPAVVLARVDGEPITAGDVDAAIEALGTPDRYEYAAAESVRALLEDLVDRRLMARAARREGLDEVVSRSGVEPAERALADAWLEREMGRVPAPGEAAIARYYREYPTAFTVPGRVRVTRVVTATREAAERLRAPLAQGMAVADLRARHARDLLDAGSLWLQDVPRAPELVTVALGLQPGAVSRVLALEAGFVVMRADETVPARLQPLAEVRAGIVASLTAAGRAQAVANARRRLRAGVEVAIDQEALRSYTAPAPEAARVPAP